MNRSIEEPHRGEVSRKGIEQGVQKRIGRLTAISAGINSARAGSSLNGDSRMEKPFAAVCSHWQPCRSGASAVHRSASDPQSATLTQ